MNFASYSQGLQIWIYFSIVQVFLTINLRIKMNFKNACYFIKEKMKFQLVRNVHVHKNLNICSNKISEKKIVEFFFQRAKVEFKKVWISCAGEKRWTSKCVYV